jgi:Holliday junction resolvase-like predicted endonuclease
MPKGNKKEPGVLIRGKQFHKKVQKEWLDDAEGTIESEKSMVKKSGRRGRMDVFVRADDEMVAVVEIKASDWDNMTVDAVKRNVQRQIRQVWNYIDSQLELGMDVCPGIVFPKRPRSSKRKKMIEQLFEGEGIPVVWDDEPVNSKKPEKGGIADGLP